MSGPAVHYRLTFDRAHQHAVRVELTLPPRGAGPLVLHLPVWSPGSYLIREYARHIEGLQARDAAGQQLPCCKTRKDEYTVQVAAPGAVTVAYDLYARELSVRTNFVNAEFALLQGTATFLRCPDLAASPHEVTLVPPAGWAGAWSGGELQKEGESWLLRVASYDDLADTPLLLGNADERAFEVDGVPHALISVGEAPDFDGRAIALDCARIVRQNAALWGGLPYRRYVFLNLLLGGYGGLEHRDSSVLLASPFSPADRAARHTFAGLVAHEHFHVWNIKRLRPLALGPFDYAAENYTPSLWVAEGLTAYYDDLQACRAGVMDEADYLGKLAKSIEALADTPGRAFATLTEASFDAWVKLYRRDENTDNTTVSYYLKGSLVGFVLDAALRRATGNARSLDDVMRLAYRDYAGQVGYTEAQFRAAASAVAGRDLREWLGMLLDSTSEMDFAPACQTYGLALSWSLPATLPSDLRDRTGSFGAHLKGGTPNAVVSQVVRGSPAWAAGLNVDDEILAVDGRRVQAQGLLTRLVAAGEQAAKVTLLVSRFGAIGSREVQLAPPRAHKAKLAVTADASPAQQAAREAWLAPL